jgi:hypothetical protein
MSQIPETVGRDRQSVYGSQEPRTTSNIIYFRHASKVLAKCKGVGAGDFTNEFYLRFLNPLEMAAVICDIGAHGMAIIYIFPLGYDTEYLAVRRI